ncbi:MAG: hypothetical protein JSW14_07215 [Candidatus Bathyarchaeum sp.]|nr:MAG: hypothetical protein JSW14_07215 [Candidatus Bathyarchaeum sp.]
MIVKKPKTDIETVQKKLQSINDQKGILGYILRGSQSASIDLKDPTKIIDYAMFSATAIDVGRNMTETLQMGEVNTIVVESEETKLLSMNINNHHLSLFMEKSVNHDKLYKNLK